MTRWLVTLGSLALIAGALRWMWLRQQDDYDADFTGHLRDWHASEPYIPALDLPAVRPLKAQTVDRFARFKRRMGTR